MLKKKILYIEDEPHLARIVRDMLTFRGFDVLYKKDGTRIAETIRQFSPDIVLLDVMLPHIDGFSLGNLVRNLFPELPLIYTTAKSQPGDIVQGFESGGTDYIRKPFSMEELAVRIDNQLRIASSKGGFESDLPDAVKLNSFVFYPGKMELHHAGDIKRLSQRESQILSLLCSYQNRTLERRLLLQKVWGDDSFFNSRNLDVYIRKLRALFKEDKHIQIITLKGEGYLFSCQT